MSAWNNLNNIGDYGPVSVQQVELTERLRNTFRDNIMRAKVSRGVFSCSSGRAVRNYIDLRRASFADSVQPTWWNMVNRAGAKRTSIYQGLRHAKAADKSNLFIIFILNNVKNRTIKTK